MCHVAVLVDAVYVPQSFVCRLRGCYTYIDGVGPQAECALSSALSPRRPGKGGPRGVPPPMPPSGMPPGGSSSSGLPLAIKLPRPAGVGGGSAAQTAAPLISPTAAAAAAASAAAAGQASAQVQAPCIHSASRPLFSPSYSCMNSYSCLALFSPSYRELLVFMPGPVPPLLQGAPSIHAWPCSPPHIHAWPCSPPHIHAWPSSPPHIHAWSCSPLLHIHAWPCIMPPPL